MSSWSFITSIDYHNNIEISVNNATVTRPVIPDTALRVITGITCSLSIIGSLLIIFTYVTFKQLRTTTRLVLVHISLMDFGVATANLVGISVNFNREYFNPRNASYSPDGWPVIHHPGSTIDALCQTQAAVAVFSTNGSILWTLCMSVYLYFRIVHHNTPSVARCTLWVSTIFCYFFPTLFVIWTLLTHRLGYSPYDSEGWCGERMVNVFTGQKYIVLSIIGYDLWICLTYFLVPILYVSILLYVRQELKRSAMFVTSERFWKAVHSLDFKLLLIPLAFLLLRVWSFIIAIVYIYMGTHLPYKVHHALVYLSAIGDSGQGFVNAILFVLFAKKVRSTLISFVCCKKDMFSDETSRLIIGNNNSDDDRLYHRENTPRVFTSSHDYTSSASNDGDTTTYTCSYKSTMAFAS